MIQHDKDISLALAPAQQLGIECRSAKLGEALLARAIERGDADAYWPVISRFPGEQQN